MKRAHASIAAVAAVFALAGGAGVFSEQEYLPGEPQHKAGASITLAFEGWFSNKDGSRSLLIGYMNRNQNQSGTVTFGKDKPKVEKTSPDGQREFSGNATTTASFSEPGDYMLHVTANDSSGVGGGGFRCCWTTGLVKARVK